MVIPMGIIPKGSSIPSLITNVKGQEQALCRRGDKIPSVDFKVGGKKKEKIHVQDPALSCLVHFDRKG